MHIFKWKEKINGRLRMTTCFQLRENNLFSTSFQRLNTTLNNVRFQRWINIRFHIDITLDFNVETTSDSTLKQRHISTLIRFNKIESIFNVKVRRCFNIVSTWHVFACWDIKHTTIRHIIIVSRLSLLLTNIAFFYKGGHIHE